MNDQASTTDETGKPTTGSQDSNAADSEKRKKLDEIPKKVKVLGMPELEVPPISEEQAELIITPVADIPATKVFVSVPLVARLTAGVPNVKELVLRQRELVKEQAAQSGSGPERPLETRVSDFTNSGSLKMSFSSPVKVPDGTSEQIQNQNVENRRRLAAGQAPVDAPIQVFAVKEELDEDELSEKLGKPIMDGWDLLKLDSDGFELQLNFTNPLQISADEEPDLLLI